MWAGEQLLGWLVMHTVGEPRAWSPRQLTIIHGVARDLGTALLQAHAFQQKEQAVLMLERADRLKNELVSNVSHELRTPLSSIIGYLELLRAGELGDVTDQQRRVLTTVSLATQIVSRCSSRTSSCSPGRTPRMLHPPHRNVSL